MTEKTPEFIVVGAPKTATTWTYQCLKEHPEVFMPDTDSANYFDIAYHRGIESYTSQFEDALEGQIIGEESAAYIFMPEVPRRISEDLGDVKLIFSVRNPIQRAFSQYWHAKRIGRPIEEFDMIFKDAGYYTAMVYPGFYHRHLQRYLEYFDEEKIKIMFFDDLKEDDETFIQDIYEFIGVDSDYESSKLRKKVNEAGDDRTQVYGKIKYVARSNLPREIKASLRPLRKLSDRFLADKSEYEEGMGEEMRKELEKVYKEDVRKLSEYTGRDLSHWFEYEDI